MVGRPYVPTDTDNEWGLTPLLGYPVSGVDTDTGERVSGTLANIQTDGLAVIENDGFVVAFCRAETIDTNEPRSYIYRGIE